MTYNELKTEFLRRVNLLKLTDMAALNHKCAEILGKIVSENVFEIDDISESCKKILREYYELMNKTNALLQKKLDEKIGLQIAAQKADFPVERVTQIAESLTDPTVPPETIQRRARSAIENVANSFHDDYVMENAKFRSKAGIKCYIVRETDGNCCKWCSSLAGRYVYGEEPDEVYHHHDNCTCTTTFENGRERQDVWSKKKWQVTPVLKIPYEPLVLDKNQAENLQNIQLAKYKNSANGLTSTKNNGTIEVPKTLLGYEKAKDAYMEKIKNTEIMKPENREAVEKALKTLIDEGDFCMGIREDVLNTIIDSNDRRFKNQMETESSMGAYNPKIRKKASEILFGVDSSQLKGRDFEKYGFLASKDKRISFEDGEFSDYGKIIIQFDKNKLFDRTTYTIGDSLNRITDESLLFAEKVSAPSVCAVPQDNFTNKTIEASKKFNIGSIKNHIEFCHDAMTEYIELQYHGDLSLDDVEVVYYQGNIDYSLKSKLEEFGIKVINVDDKKGDE